MNTKTDRYFRKTYFQKSKLLFGIISDLQMSDCEELIQTYLFSNEIEENVLDYYLLCEFSTEFKLSVKLENILTNIYQTVDNTFVYVFHLIDYKDDVDKFLKGDYSNFSEESKNNIMFFYYIYPKSDTDEIIKIPTQILKDKKKGSLQMHVFFNHKDYIEELSEEMTDVIYDSKEEAIHILKDMKEILEIYDRERETLNKKIKL